MGNILTLSGLRYNVLQTGTVTVSTEDALYPKSRLYDDRPIQPFKTTDTSNETIDIDGNRIVNGDLDDWSAGAPVGWSVLGTITEEVAIVRSGSAVRITGGSIFGIYQDFTVKSGERVVLNGWRRITAAGQGEFLGTLLNLDTGHYWDGAAWQTGAPAFLTDTTNTSYTQFGPTALTVEPFSVVGRDTCTLRLMLQNIDSTATDYVYVDDWFLWPSIDFCAIFGNNIGASVQVRIERGATSALGTTEGLMTVAKPSFYSSFATVRDDRFWQIEFVGDNLTPLVLGEVVLGKATTLTRRMTGEGYTIEDVFDTIAAVTETGDHMAVSRSEDPRTNLSMEFKFTGTSADTDLDQQRAELFKRCHGDARSVVIVPDSARPEVVMGKVNREFGVRRFLSDYYTDRTLVVNGMPFPLLTE